MTSNHVRSIRRRCREITQGMKKTYEIPGITTSQLSQSNYFVCVCSGSPATPLSLNSSPRVNTLLFLTTHSVTCTCIRLYPHKTQNWRELNPDTLKCQRLDACNDICSTVHEHHSALCGFQHFGFSSGEAAFVFNCLVGFRKQELILIVHLKLVPFPLNEFV